MTYGIYDVYRILNGGEQTKTLPEEQQRQRRAAIFNEQIQRYQDALAGKITGPLLIFLGTMLWGYGDLVGDVLFGTQINGVPGTISGSKP